ncbi:MAG: hypothetical protein KJO42_00620, partial [Silicimonas sp.]|nr:hypothetical protein [Silicimonas sp.]
NRGNECLLHDFPPKSVAGDHYPGRRPNACVPGGVANKMSLKQTTAKRDALPLGVIPYRLFFPRPASHSPSGVELDFACDVEKSTQIQFYVRRCSFSGPRNHEFNAFLKRASG